MGWLEILSRIAAALLVMALLYSIARFRQGKIRRYRFIDHVILIGFLLLCAARSMFRESTEVFDLAVPLGIIVYFGWRAFLYPRVKRQELLAIEAASRAD